MNRMLVRTRVAGLGVLVFALSAQVASAGHYTWTTSGPEAGLIFQIGVNPADETRVNTFAGYFGGYFFQSENGGESWSFVSGVFGSSFVQDPADSETLYAPAYGGVYRSKDGGSTWSLVPLPGPTTYAQSVSAAPSLPGRLYAVAGYSPVAFFRSDDGGSSWVTVPTDLPAGYPMLATDPDDSQTIYAVMGSQLYRSLNGGANWLPYGTGFPETGISLSFDPNAPSTVYATTAYAGVYKSTDRGATWNPMNTGIETQYVRGLAIDPTDSQTLYAAGSGSSNPSGPGGLFVSSNGGSSWTPIDIGLSPPFVSAIAIDPHNHQRLFVGAGTSTLRGHILESLDAGTTWSPAEKGLSGFLAYSVAPDPAAAGSSFAVAGSRVYRSEDVGADWSLLATLEHPVNDLVVDPGDAMVLYGCYQGPDGGGGIAGGVYKSIDGGTNWSDPAGPFTTSNMYRLAISGSNPQTLLASTDEGVFQTATGGDSWDNVLPGYAKGIAIDPSDDRILFAGLETSNSPGEFLRSPDGGATWTAPEGAPARWTPSIVINPLAPDVVYVLFPIGPAAAPLSDAVYRSADHGLTFSPAGTGLSGADVFLGQLAIDPSQASIVYAAPAQGGGVFRTTDSATSWKPLAQSIPAFNSLDFSVSANGRTLYAATISGAFSFDRSFVDVPDADPFWAAVDAAAMNGVSAGCGRGNFCPASANTRAQIAVFLLRAKHNAAFAPPPATGAVFGDVPASSFAAAWIEELSREGITSGCGGGNYCPSAELSRAEMAVMVLKALHGADYEPPPATGAVFADVPADAFAAAWIEELAAEGISAGCGGGNFCPDASLTRAQAAALLTHAFHLS